MLQCFALCHFPANPQLYTATVGLRNFTTHCEISQVAFVTLVKISAFPFGSCISPASKIKLKPAKISQKKIKERCRKIKNELKTRIKLKLKEI